HRSVADASDAGVPQRRSIARAQRQRIARGIARERQSGSGGQNTSSTSAATQVVAPASLSSLILARAQDTARVHVVVGPGPSVLAMLRLEEVDAVSVVRTDDQQTRCRIEAR